MPHIYVSTESDRKERKARAKQRAAKQRDAQHIAASQPSASAPSKGLGTLLKAKAEPETSVSEDDVQSLKEEEGLMQHVQREKKDTAPRKGIGIWTMMRDRIGGSRSGSPPEAPAKNVLPVAREPIDEQKDTFLRRASAIPASSAREKEQEDTPKSALDEVGENPVPVVQKHELPKGPVDAAKKQEVRRALEDNADIADASAAPLPEAKIVQEQPAKKRHAPQFQAPSGMKAFLTSLSYIGMGKERFLFIQNMATMLGAGLPLIDSLKTLILETRNKSMRKLEKRIIDMVENGSPLWRAMEAQSFFSLHALALVRIGEEAGNLAENMGYLAVQDEKDHALRSKVKMAMIYPTIVLIIMFIIIVGLGMFVLPNLVGVLFSLNVELPLITRIVIWCSDMFTTHGAVGIPSVVAGFLLILILSKYTRLSIVTQWFLFRIPGIGRLAREATIARFGVILGGLLKAGVPVVEALQSLVQVTSIQAYRSLYSQMLARITIGDSFSKCFSNIKGSHRLLPPSVQQLVITGEKSGSLADIMLKVADIYDKKATETAEKLPIILEPMLLLFIGGLVGSIAFAIIVPIYSIVGNIGA